MNEGFATYVSYIGQQLVDPESGPQDRFVLENNQFAFELDSTDASHSVRPDEEDVANPVDIGLLFDAIREEAPLNDVPKKQGGNVGCMMETRI